MKQASGQGTAIDLSIHMHIMQWVLRKTYVKIVELKLSKAFV